MGMDNIVDMALFVLYSDELFIFPHSVNWMYILFMTEADNIFIMVRRGGGGFSQNFLCK